MAFLRFSIGIMQLSRFFEGIIRFIILNSDNFLHGFRLSYGRSENSFCDTVPKFLI